MFMLPTTFCFVTNKDDTDMRQPKFAVAISKSNGKLLFHQINSNLTLKGEVTEKSLDVK